MMLSNEQTNDLARSLSEIVSKFYENPENEEGYQKWLRNVERRESDSTVTKL